MAYQYQTLSKDNPKITISLKADKRYFKLLGIFSENMEAEELSNLSFDLKLKSNNNSHSFEEPISIGRDIMSIGAQDYVTINCTPSSELGSSVTILADDLPEGISELGLIYDIDNLSIPVANPFKDFDNHLKHHNNPRILFSAPFGHGKTTFLNLYFDEKQNDYEVFHIYPVNFSVANNEDIFRYIKTELLFQLLGRDIEFEKVDINSVQSVSTFIGENIHNVFAPFIRLLPLIGRSLHDIYKDLYALAEKYKEGKKDEQLSEEEQAKSFIKEVYEKEGSIFEDNFYTQLIRQLIEQLKENGKQVVWVIDDLDRMDPDHIFRILNVLSAHVDDYNSEMLGFSNKFGFDKTIIVGDYNNLVSIFKHKYGANTDSRGYFDKFFSKNIYYYNNVDAIQGLVDEYTFYGDQNVNASTSIYRLLLRMFLKTNNLSLRELIQLRSIGNKFLKKTFRELDIFIPIYMLRKCFAINDIELKLNNTSVNFDEKSDYDINYDSHVWQVLMFLSETIEKDGQKQQVVSFKDHHYSFRTESRMRTESVDQSSILVNGKKPDKTYDLFGGKDFNGVAVLLFEKYKSNEIAIEKEFKKFIY